jgi:two-component system sensor histidine kinase DesK
MRAWLQRVDRFLLPRDIKENFSPYVWLIYLPLFFVPVFIFSTSLTDTLITCFATLVFLAIYFHSYWVSHNNILFHIVTTITLGTACAFVTPTASSLFIYGAAFCSRLKPIKYAYVAVFIILLWLVLISWYFEFTPFFSIPSLIFSFIVGVLNIYQSVLDDKRQELYLSQQEVKHLAQVAERERIARDLHDLIGHTFSVITLKAALAGRLLDKDKEKARNEITQLETISRDALSQVREVVSGYRTSDLLSELANAKHLFASLDIDFKYQFDLQDVQNQPVNLDTYLTAKGNKELAIMLRELVTNIIKHANASEVNVTIRQRDNTLILLVEDNGCGLTEDQSQGVGLKGIQERVQALKGFASFTSSKPQTGTRSEIGLPIISATQAASL